MSENSSEIVVSAIQITAVDGEKEATVAKMFDLLDTAGKRGTQLCVLPELWTGLGFSDESIYRSIAEPIPGPVTQRLAEKARQYGMYIAGSMYEEEGGELLQHHPPHNSGG